MHVHYEGKLISPNELYFLIQQILATASDVFI